MPDQLYRSFLLRLWQVHGVDGIVWRASLEDAHSGTRVGFSSIDRLHEFLLDQTDAAQGQSDMRARNDTTSATGHDDVR